MVDFTPLERAVFAAISAPYEEVGDADLAKLLASARALNRERNGYGFFTSFTVDRTLAALAVRRTVIHGPDLLVSAGPYLLQMGFVLWIDEAGFPECLEGFQYAASPEAPLEFEAADLADLAPIGDPYRPV
jgi:hypothetical protein